MTSEAVPVIHRRTRHGGVHDRRGDPDDIECLKALVALEYCHTQLIDDHGGDKEEKTWSELRFRRGCEVAGRSQPSSTCAVVRRGKLSPQQKAAQHGSPALGSSDRRATEVGNRGWNAAGLPTREQQRVREPRPPDTRVPLHPQAPGGNRPRSTRSPNCPIRPVKN